MKTYKQFLNEIVAATVIPGALFATAAGVAAINARQNKKNKIKNQENFPERSRFTSKKYGRGTVIGHNYSDELFDSRGKERQIDDGDFTKIHYNNTKNYALIHTYDLHKHIERI